MRERLLWFCSFHFSAKVLLFYLTHRHIAPQKHDKKVLTCFLTLTHTKYASLFLASPNKVRNFASQNIEVERFVLLATT